MGYPTYYFKYLDPRNFGRRFKQVGNSEESARGLAEKVHSFLSQPDASWALDKPVAIQQVIRDNMESLTEAAQRLLDADDQDRERIIMELLTPVRVPSFAEGHIQAGQRMLIVF